MIPLDNTAMQRYLTEGNITVQTDFHETFHRSIYDRAEEIFESDGNPGNDIYPRIPELGNVFRHPRVHDALTAILGPDYIMHPHRHCHQTPPGKGAQSNHKDSYEDDENVRHHRSRWAMAFYYPRDVDEAYGPTVVTPGSQYYTQGQSLGSLEEKKLCGPAGTVTIVHYDLWHRASENLTDQNRYMMKFLFCRRGEPASASWNHADDPPNFRRHRRLCEHLWRWHAGKRPPLTGGQDLVTTLVDRYRRGLEPERLDAAYRLGETGRTETLLELLASDIGARLDGNLERRHTNACQVDAIYGLTAADEAAVPALTDALSHSDWWMRAAAADALGDIGRSAASATRRLADALEDESEWVRRNATEALGNLNAEEAVNDLGKSLSDESDRVRHNAALSLVKIGPPAAGSRRELTDALDDENRYVRALSRLALDAISD